MTLKIDFFELDYGQPHWLSYEGGNSFAKPKPSALKPGARERTKAMLDEWHAKQRQMKQENPK